MAQFQQSKNLPENNGWKVSATTRQCVQSLAIALSLAMTACSDGGSSSANSIEPSSPTTIALQPDVTVETQARKLQEFESAEAFEQTLKETLLNHYLNQGGQSGLVTPAPLPAPQQPQGAADSVDLSTTTLATTAESGGTVQLSNGLTTTNLQEAGVDEADRVKSDGRFLFVLDNTPGRGVAVPFPIIDLPIVLPEPLPIDQVGSTDTIGSSQFYQPNSVDLRILELDSSNADATLVHESTLQIGGQSVDGMYLTGADNNALVLTSTSHGGAYWGYWDVPSFWGTTSSSIHHLNVADRNNPSLTETASFDGQIISSRVVGDYMYLVSRSSLIDPVFNPYEQTVSVEEAVAALDITSVMPQYHLSDGSSSPLASAANCFVTDLPQNSYYLPDIVTLAAINLSDLTVSDSVCYLGSVETLYASTSAAFLANTFYRNDFAVPLPLIEQPLPVEPLPVVEPERPSPQQPLPPVSSATTEIHQFNFRDGELEYTGSGQVDGFLSGSSQQRSFRFSHVDGYLRVVTENDAAVSAFESTPFDTSPERSPVFVSVMQPAGEGVLETVARLPDESQPLHIGKPGEQLHASRFIGNKAYLVTFRQTDPLYVIDFSNPERPAIAGELTIEGYSDYLHPVGENFLLGLGRGAIPDASGWGDNGRGAFATGIKISLFDISNPNDPREIQAIEIGKRGSNAESLFDHHGVTFRPGTDSEPGRLAFGIDVNDIPTDDGFSQVPFHSWRETGLHTFEIHSGNNPGIVESGKMIVEAASPQNPWGPTRFGDRSVLVDNAVFYIHGEQVFAALWGSVENYNGPR